MHPGSEKLNEVDKSDVMRLEKSPFDFSFHTRCELSRVKGRRISDRQSRNII